jgi:DedD protein
LKIAMKQRLVGTIIIGCLVIIFLPILLDGEGITPPAMNTAMPASPPMPQTPVIEPVRVETAPESSMSINAASTTEEDTAMPEQEAAKAEPPPAPAQPRLADNGLPETWAVRLGSFGEKANAEGLIARLQERGHKAFARPIQTSRGTLTGVYVGPVLTEREAGRLQQELAGAFELEGVVVQFSLDDLAN